MDPAMLASRCGLLQLTAVIALLTLGGYTVQGLAPLSDLRPRGHAFLISLSAFKEGSKRSVVVLCSCEFVEQRPPHFSTGHGDDVLVLAAEIVRRDI